jgi:hypothetical protein
VLSLSRGDIARELQSSVGWSVWAVVGGSCAAVGLQQHDVAIDVQHESDAHTHARNVSVPNGPRAEIYSVSTFDR